MKQIIDIAFLMATNVIDNYKEQPGPPPWNKCMRKI